MKQNERQKIVELVAQCLEVPSSEVIDNNDGETVTIYNTTYSIIKLEFGLTEYEYAIFAIK